jgi:hypothetical protein
MAIPCFCRRYGQNRVARQLGWQASADANWLHLFAVTGSATSVVEVRTDPTGLPSQEHTGVITIVGAEETARVQVRLAPPPKDELHLPLVQH